MPKILVVDENEDFRRGIVYQLKRQMQAEITECGDIETLEQLINDSQRQFDVILIEEQLPKRMGDTPEPIDNELHVRIKAQRPNTKIIVFSAGYDNPAELENIYVHLNHNLPLTQLGSIVKIAALSQNLPSLANRKEWGELLRHIVSEAIKLLNCQRGGIFRYDPNRNGAFPEYDYTRTFRSSPVILSGQGMIGRIIADNLTYICDVDYANSPYAKEIPSELHRIGASIVMPFKVEEEFVGFIYLEDEVGRIFSDQDIELLRLFCDQAAIAFENARLLHENKLLLRQAEADRQRLKTITEMSSQLGTLTDLEQVLQNIADMMLTIAQACSTVVTMIDEIGIYRSLVAAGTDKSLGTLNPYFRKDGISMKVFHSGKPEMIEDAEQHPYPTNPSWGERNILAAVCLPIYIQKRRLGVLWIYYPTPRPFSENEIEAWQLFVNHAAIAYSNSRQIQELNYLSDATESLIGVTHPRETLQMIANGARQMLDATSTSVWVYDHKTGRYIFSDSVASGLDKNKWRHFERAIPRQGGTARSIMKLGLVAIHDTSKQHHDLVLGKESQRFAHNNNVHSFLGVALTAGNIHYGILYINYDRPRSFSDRERATAQTFARHATLALQRTRQFELLNSVQDHLRHISATQSSIEATLNAIAAGVKRLMQAEAVTIYPYDKELERFVKPHIQYGALFDHIELPMNTRYKTWNRVIQLDEIYKIERNLQADPILGCEFALLQGFEAVAAVPLIANQEKFGVLFIYFRTPHRFLEEEIDPITMLANQAALAIRNAHSAQRAENRLRASNTLMGAIQSLIGYASIDDILDSIAQLAWKLIQAHSRHVVLCDILLREKNYLKRHAAIPIGEARLIGPIDLEQPRSGIVGRAFLTQKTQFVPDVELDEDYLCNAEGTQSELAIPIILGNNRSIGVINIEFSVKSGCADIDITVLESLAVTAAAAIENFYQMQQKEVLYLASKAIASTIPDNKGDLLNELLHQIIKHVKPISGCNIKHCVVETIDLPVGKNPQFTIVGVHPPSQKKLFQDILTRKRSSGAKLGITGRAILMRRTQLVHDVHQDSDYIELDPTIRSEIVVPILDEHQQPIGVINLESEQLDAFEWEDVDTVEALAELVRIEIRNMQVGKQLAQARERSQSAIALAQVSMIGTHWHHNTLGKAQTIDELAMLIQQDIAFGQLGEISEYADDIRELAQEIKARPLFSRLAMDRAKSISLNRLLNKRIGELKRVGLFQHIEFIEQYSICNDVTVRVNESWMRVVIDCIVENAREAMRSVTDVPQVTVSTRYDGAMVETRFADNGTGIDPAIRPKLLRISIDKKLGSSGAGVGLLMSQLIIQTYGGRMRFEDNAPKGTVMIITLPREQ